MTAQLDLFEDIPQVAEDEDLVPTTALQPRGTCGKCRWMDTTLPGCLDGVTNYGVRYTLGRCTNPDGRSYWLLPENTRSCPVTGKLPLHGSWHWVEKDSCACDQVARR